MEQEILYTLNRSVAKIERELRKMETKNGVGAQVRRDQLRASKAAMHREIASLWRLMGSEVNARRAEAAATAVGQLFNDYERVLWNSALKKPDVDLLLRAAQASARRSIDAVETRLLGYSRIPLSERVYKSQKLATGQIDRIVDQALARGASWKELADDVRIHIRPNVPGGLDYAAKRLARTELANAFHASAVRHAMRTPTITGLKWNLSGSHKKPDECNDYAGYGGDGIWTPDEVPAKPHPQCLCYLTPVTLPKDEFVEQYKAGAYDETIDQIMNDGGMTFT